MNSQEPLDRIRVGLQSKSPEVEQRSRAEEADFKKRSPAANAQLLQDRMRERNERRIERFESEISELRDEVTRLNDETKSQHGELEKLRERKGWRNWFGGLATGLAVAGGVIVPLADKSDFTKLFWTIPQPAWFLTGILMIALSGILSFILSIRS